LIHVTDVGILSNGVFLPWHRWYILEMETILIQGQKEYNLASDCCTTFVGIPYFDWHNLKNGESLNEFINNENDEYGHHFHDSLGQNSDRHQCGDRLREGALAGFRLTNGDFLTRCWSNNYAEDDPETELHRVWSSPFQYDQFRNRLEYGSGFHGTIHQIISGVMETSHAANDPIFFTHHANVDKLWGDWQKQSIEHRDAFRTHFGSWVRNYRMPGSTATPVDMLDLNRQRYIMPGQRSNVILSVEYVDLDTRSMWGDGNTLSLRFN
jgi:tyrosinase